MTRILFASHLQSVEHSLWEVFQRLSRHQQGAVAVVDAAHVELMDKSLWQRPQLAFMPHAVIGDSQSITMPLLLATAEDLSPFAINAPELAYVAQHVDAKTAEKQPATRGLLINIGGDPLAVFARFTHLLELIPSAEHPNHAGFGSIDQAIESGRQRFRCYRDRGYDLTHASSSDSFIGQFDSWWQP